MPFYRFYLLDADDGVISIEWTDLPDDDRTLDHAAEMLGNAAKVSIWDGVRFVGEMVIRHR